MKPNIFCDHVCVGPAGQLCEEPCEEFNVHMKVLH